MALDFPTPASDGEIYDRYKWNATDSVWELNLPEYVDPPTPEAFSIDYLAIGGGGGGGDEYGGGGGAGAYRTGTITAYTLTDMLVRIGSGGAGAPKALYDNPGSNGQTTVFHTIISGPGGGGGSYAYAAAPDVDEGSGGGGGGNSTPGATSGPYGNNGGNGVGNPGTGGGGGGAAEAGNTDGNGHGGDGLAWTYDGVTRAGGGAGYGGVAGDGGAGAPQTSATANTGSGGGGGIGGTSGTVGNGGSGIVKLRYPDTYTITVGAGLTSSTTTAGGYSITEFTAGIDTIEFSVT